MYLQAVYTYHVRINRQLTSRFLCSFFLSFRIALDFFFFLIKYSTCFPPFFFQIFASHSQETRFFLGIPRSDSTKIYRHQPKLDSFEGVVDQNFKQLSAICKNARPIWIPDCGCDFREGVYKNLRLKMLKNLAENAEKSNQKF